MKEENWKEKRTKINKLKKGKLLFSMHFHNIYRLGTAQFYACKYETHNFLKGARRSAVG
jgi:hypothetical protein